jgi:hypothetical protein
MLLDMLIPRSKEQAPTIPDSIAAAAAKQIQQSGMLDCLSAVVAAAAKHLQDLPSSIAIQTFPNDFEEKAYLALQHRSSNQQQHPHPTFLGWRQCCCQQLHSVLG